MPNPFISLILPAYNEESLLPSTLASLRSSFGKLLGDQMEIVVCDNNSSDRTASVAQQHGARVIFEPHNQIARARNTGARVALGDWLIFVDADTCVPARLAEQTLAAIHSGHCGAGGAPVLFDLQSLPLSSRMAVQSWNWVSRTFHLAAGSYLFCRREAWKDSGGFDETYYAGEEIFFSIGLKKWCRKQRLAFTILQEPVLTSARKLQWHTQTQIWRAVLRAAWPGAITRRESCAYWHHRPDPPVKPG